MRTKFALISATAIACFVGAVAAVPSSAQESRYFYPRSFSPYQGPDGSYASLADFSRDVWGVPCGMECMRDA